MMILCDGRLNYSSSRRRVLDEWLMLRFRCWVSDRRWFYGWLDEHFFQHALKLFYRIYLHMLQRKISLWVRITMQKSDIGYNCHNISRCTPGVFLPCGPREVGMGNWS
jgi:hypothetical protein